jgi:hypothetical protein
MRAQIGGVGRNALGSDLGMALTERRSIPRPDFDHKRAIISALGEVKPAGSCSRR